MPGRVLVLDPIVTNRIMLKAQLSMDFFDVTLASDLTELQNQARKIKPDLVLVSYQADRASNFDAVRWMKSNPALAYTPVVFLQNVDEQGVWDQSHDLMVDDVLHYRASKWLMSARINLLIRAKERLDAIAAQGRTISDMGFAESGFVFPPPPRKPITIDLSLATASFPAPFARQLETQLRVDFPNVTVTTTPPLPTNPPADIHVVDPSTEGSTNTFAKMIAIRRKDGPLMPNILFVARAKDEPTSQRALEFGVSDFALQDASAAEMACRLRRILWYTAVAQQADKSLSKHLQSALIDPLTGLYNRRYALQYLSRLLRDRSHHKSALTGMVLDLDRFKQINDTYGHLTGDAVIQQTAQRLKNNLRSADLVARIGGEEFLIILENASEDRVRHIAERMRSEISSKPFVTADGQPIAVSASIGVSASRSDWHSSDAIIQCADIALYRAKDSGRDCVTFSEKAA